MKKDRQCGVAPYPTYGATPGMGMQGMYGTPGMGMQGMYGAPGMYGTPGMMPGTQTTPGYGAPQTVTPGVTQGGNVEQQLNRMQQQIDMLDRRVSRLETNITDGKSMNYNNTKYTDSNYYMM